MSETMKPPALSIVTTLFRSARFIEPFYSEACRVAGELGLPFEIVFVNDGSPDDSLEIAHALQMRDGRVTLVDLSRNFGHHRALMTAFAYASANLVYVTDVDLEEPMDFLRICHERFQQGDCDVVYGYQVQRRGNWFTRVSGELFWKLFNILCNIDVPKNVVIARLMSKRYVASLLQHRENDPFIAGLWVATGYKQVGLPIVKSFTGVSSYSNFRRFSLAVNSIVSFSGRPLLLCAGVGIFICLAASVYIAYLLGRWLIMGNPIEGWTSLIISVWLLGGTNLFFIGLVGLYISRIYTEVKRRPNVIIRAVYAGSPPIRSDRDPSARIVESQH